MQEYRAAFTLTVENTTPTVENTSDNRNKLYLDTSNSLTVTASSDGSLIMAQAAYFVVNFGMHFPSTAWDGVLPSATGLFPTLVSADHPTKWKFTPTSTPWTVPEKLIITMPGITTTKDNSPKTVSLTFSWFGLQGTYDDGRMVMLDVVHSPDPALHDLALVIEWCDLSSSDTGADVQPINLSSKFEQISNTIYFMIMNPLEKEPVVVPVVGAPSSQPKFCFTFNTVEGEGESGAVDALCTLEQAKLITAKAVVGDSDWIAASQGPDEDLNWNLNSPTNVLGAGESIIIEIAGIISSLPAYATAMYLNWSDVPGYNDGSKTLPMKKQAAPPTITSFTYSSPDPEGITMGQQVTLSWVTFGSAQSGPVSIYDQANPSDILVQTGDAIGSHTFPIQATTTYVLELANSNPTLTAIRTVPVQPVSVSALTVTPQQDVYNFGDKVTLNANLGFAQAYWIEGAPAGPVSVMGSGVASESVTLGSGVDSYTLKATGYQGPVSASCNIVWNLKIAFVDKFVNTSDSLQFTAINGEPPLVWRIDNSDVFSMTPQGLLSVVNNSPPFGPFTFTVTVTSAQGKSASMVCIGFWFDLDVPTSTGNGGGILNFGYGVEWFTNITGSYQVGLDIQSSNTYYRLFPGSAMILTEPVTADRNLIALNVMLADVDGAIQGTPVALVFDRTLDSQGNATFTLSQTSYVLFFNPQSYGLQRLTLAPPLKVLAGQVIGLVNHGPNNLFLNWVDGAYHHVWIPGIQIPIPIIAGGVWSTTCGAGDLGVSCVACGWNFTGLPQDAYEAFVSASLLSLSK